MENDSQNSSIVETIDSTGGKEVSLSPLKLLQNEIEETLKSNLKVPLKLNSPDKLIIASQEILTKQKPDNFRYHGVVSCNQKALDIRVAPKNIGRALRFIDTFIKAVRLRGYDIYTKYDKVYVAILGFDFPIKLHEKMTKVIVKGKTWDSTEYHPIGILAFKVDMYLHKEWKDGKKLKLEDQLSNIIASLELTGKEWREDRIKSEEKERIRKEKEQQERDLIAKQENELAAFKTLLNKVQRWHESQILREYINSRIEDSKDKESPDFQKWVAWAMKKADWYDPTIEFEDEDLSIADRETLTIKKKVPAPINWNLNLGN